MGTQQNRANSLLCKEYLEILALFGARLQRKKNARSSSPVLQNRLLTRFWGPGTGHQNIEIRGLANRPPYYFIGLSISAVL